MLLLGCNIVGAQSALGVGALRGSVLDASEGVVGGATVTLTETSKGWVRTSESAGDGSFLFASVIAGVYSVRVDMSGFATEQMDNLKIEVGQQASVTIRLQPAGVETSIIVTAPTSAELNAQSNTIGSLVDSEQVRELPLNGRNFLQLALLSGGVERGQPGEHVFTSNVGPPGRLVVLPGTFPYSVGYSLNGFNIRSSRDGELALSPSVAAVDQFKVQVSFLMPDQGASSAVVNIVTKSGSNQFHGEVFEFLPQQGPGRQELFCSRERGPEAKPVRRRARRTAEERPHLVSRVLRAAS